MTDYEQLVKALRCCTQNPPETCVGCTYNIGNNECAVRGMMCDAAAAIEALQDTVQAQDKALKECARQLAKMGPKRGEWEREMDVNDEPFYQCSVCGECFDFNSDSTHEVFNYCPNCGADMRKMEVQDGKRCD